MTETVLTPDLSWFNLLAGFSGFCWTVCYALCIWHGFRSRTCLMPVAALSLNICWEAFFGFLWSPEGLDRWQMWINRTWCVADVAILVTFYRFSDRVQRAYGTVVLASTVAIYGAFYYLASATPEGLVRLHQVSAFVVGVPMSFLFLSWVLTRTIGPWASLGVAWAKFIGTLVVTLGFTFFSGEHVIAHYPVILTCGWVSGVIDGGYVWLVWRAVRRAGGAHAE